MKEASPLQRVNSEARGLYDSFMSTLRLLHEVTDPSIRKMWTEELQDLLLRAEKLLGSGALGPTQESQMKILLSRPADQCALLSKDNSPVVPSF